MIESVENILKNKIATTDGLYYKLILLVGDPGCGKTKVLNRLSKKIGVDILNLNLLISKQLLEMTLKQRSLQLPKIFEKVIRSAKEIAILDNIEILFDTNLKQDPLRLLQKNSRNKTIISSWSGKQDGPKLIYAEAGHCEYGIYNSLDILTVNMNNENNL